MTELEKSFMTTAQYLNLFMEESCNRNEYIVLRFKLNKVCADTNVQDLSGRSVFVTGYDLLKLSEAQSLEQVLKDFYNILVDKSITGSNGRKIKHLLKLVPNNPSIQFESDLKSVFTQFNDEYQVITNGRVIKIRNNEGIIVFKTYDIKKAIVFLNELSIN